MSEDDDNVVSIDKLTRNEIPSDEVLEAAKGKLEYVVVLGYTNDDELYFACTQDDCANILWLLEQTKLLLLQPEEIE